MRPEVDTFTEADHRAAVEGAINKEWSGLRAVAGDVNVGARVAGATPEEAHNVTISVLLDPDKQAIIGQTGGLLLGSHGFRTLILEVENG